MDKYQNEPSVTKSADSTKTITAEEFDRRFDDGEDMSDFIDWSDLKIIGPSPKRVNVDFPPLMVRELDAVASERGVTRQALIKMWLADKLDEHNHKTPGRGDR